MNIINACFFSLDSMRFSSKFCTSRNNGHGELVGCQPQESAIAIGGWCTWLYVARRELLVVCSKALAGTKWTVSNLFDTNEHKNLLSPL